MATPVTIVGLGTIRDPNASHRIRIVLRKEDGSALEYAVNENTIKNKTEAQVMDFIDQWAITNNILLPAIFVHKNDDNSWAVATGENPLVWPEDEPDDEP